MAIESRMKPQSATVLLLADRRSSQTARILKAAGYRVMTTFTPDHAVAICVNNPVNVVILDQQHFIETEGWTVAKSLKMIRQTVCVILVVRGKMIGHHLPAGVDAVVTENETQALLNLLKDLLRAA